MSALAIGAALLAAAWAARKLVELAAGWWLKALLAAPIGGSRG